MKIELIAGIILFVAMLGALAKGVMSMFRTKTAPTRRSEEESIIIPATVFDDSSIPRCVCGEVATEPAPVLHRSRGGMDFLRNIYGAPPRYSRKVELGASPTLCRVHSHVADAKMDEFIYGRVRAVLAEANAKIATEAASFERESMLLHLRSSLTDSEKKNLRKNSTSNGVSNGTSNVVSISAASDGN